MTEHVSALTLFAWLVILLLIIAAAYTWLLYRDYFKRFQVTKIETKNFIAQYNQTSDQSSFFQGYLKKKQIEEMVTPPWLITVQWIFKHQVNSNDCRLRLEDEIHRYYIDLTGKAEWIKSIAPSTGLLFTVLGLMVVLMKQSHGLNQQQMLGDIGMALFTTAFSSIVLIAQVTLLGKLYRLKENEFSTGMHVIECMFKRRKKGRTP